MNYLTKSDFKVARTCATKLFYRKKKYPSMYDDDPYMQLLAEGGYMVGKLAQLLHPGGILIADLDVTRSVDQTRELLRQDTIVLFEPAIFHGGFLARIDILIKTGSRFQLIEVKSKAGDSTKRPSAFRGIKGGIEAGWKEYIEDVTYQRYVLGLAYPQAQIDCSLLLPDKSKRTTLENLPSQFYIRRTGKEINVDYHGNPSDLIADDLLTRFEVNAEVEELLPEVAGAAMQFLPLVQKGPVRVATAITYHCKNCEFQSRTPDLPDGFKECWSERGLAAPHLFELGHLNSLNTKKSGFLVQRLIDNGTTSLYDVPLEQLTGAYGARQSIQIRYTRNAEEWRGPQLEEALSALSFPLHFIDFETSRIALPYHRGMRPYEQVTFQWSCHTVAGPDAEPSHQEWINVADSFPNFEFARQLRRAIGDDGAVLTWSHFEKAVLKDIALQMQAYGENDPELRAWIDRLVEDDGRMVDLAKICEESYFHPRMRGKTSIKYVLPAVWESNEALRQLPCFAKYAKVSEGKLLDPYRTLPSIEIMDHAEVIEEGTGAMRAYQEMLYGQYRENYEIRERWRTLLLQYCELDTAAMVMIWKHWQPYTPATPR